MLLTIRHYEGTSKRVQQLLHLTCVSLRIPILIFTSLNLLDDAMQ
jgi:hypothetical protein